MDEILKQQEENECYTYFQIVGDFDPDEITKN